MACACVRVPVRACSLAGVRGLLSARTSGSATKWLCFKRACSGVLAPAVQRRNNNALLQRRNNNTLLQQCNGATLPTAAAQQCTDRCHVLRAVGAFAVCPRCAVPVQMWAG